MGCLSKPHWLSPSGGRSNELTRSRSMDPVTDRLGRTRLRSTGDSLSQGPCSIHHIGCMFYLLFESLKMSQIG